MPGLRRPNLKLRFFTLAEIVGVAALVIAGLEYMNARHDSLDREHAQAEAAAEKAARSTLLFKGQVADKGDVVRLNPVDPDQVVQTVTVWFPKEVRADKVEIDGVPRIQAAWIADGLRKAAGKSDGGRMPVAVETVFIQDGQTRTDEAVYNLAYSLHRRLLLGEEVKLEGLSLVTRKVKGEPQAAADKLWGK